MKALIVLALLAAAVPALAQDADPARTEKRFGKLESEMRAVQRKVFPGGDARFFEPEVGPAAPVVAAPVGNPATTPITDLTVRVGELEKQIQVLTGQNEAFQFKLRQVNEAQTKARADFEFRLNALEAAAKPATEQPQLVTPKPSVPVVKGVKLGDAAKAKPDPVPPAKPLSPAAAWTAAYANVTAKKWGEAATAMETFLADNPKSPRAPQAQYWLGKAHAEQGEHAQAARAYLELYKTYPDHARAPDGLIGLATAMTALKKPKDACRVLAELDAYGDKLTGGQKADAATARTKAKCPA